MKCPSCQTSVRDDAAICPKCDRILDPSLFSNEPQAQAKSKGAPVRVRRSTQSKKVASHDETRVTESPARTAFSSEEETPRPDKDPRDLPEYEPPLDGASPTSIDPEQFLLDVRVFIASLSSADRMTFWGAIGTLVSCYLPWKETAQEGDSIGLMSWGVVVFVATVGTLASLIIRLRTGESKRANRFPWVVQLSTATFAMLWCLILLKIAIDPQKVRPLYGAGEVWASKPGIGLIFAIIGTAVVLVGTFFGMRESDAPHSRR